ncbi:MAG: hypothetical protein AVDCRST_MAG93-4203, partial [uncultured Chloroflexia bacterium]
VASAIRRQSSAQGTTTASIKRRWSKLYRTFSVLRRSAQRTHVESTHDCPL